MPRPLPAALPALLLFPAIALAWGPRGHRIVARLAEARLAPVARARVHDLLGDQTLADVANWADDVKRDRPQTADWHFVDIPIARDRYVPAVDCQRTARGDCAIAALTRQRNQLASPKTSRAKRIEALEFVVHLVGDVHQPLHAADNDDHGGNDELVRFEGRPMKLHAVWDSGVSDQTHLDETAYVRRLGSWLASQDTGAMERGTVTDWVLEAHELARTRAYRDSDGKLIRNGDVLGRAYFAASRPVVDRQLARAGVRLARVLNDAFGAGSTPP